MKNRSDNVIHHDSYRESLEDLNNENYGQCSDELNGFSFDESQEGSVGKKMAGVIFMCNVRVRTNCFRYKVFGMPFSKKKFFRQCKARHKIVSFRV